jgi:predicted nucleotidyltransferase
VLNSFFEKLPSNVKGYIIEAYTLSQRILGKDSVKGIVLFGSHARNGVERASNVSDIDLIVKIADDVPVSQLKLLDAYLDALEIKHGLRLSPNTLFSKFLRVVEKTTGMFVSHFMVRERDWLDCNFSKIFRVNGFLSRLLAPERIVLKSMSLDCISICGEGLCAQDSIKIRIIDVLKSMIMNLVLCMAGNFLSPFVKGSEKYILEAIKWSLRAGYFYLKEKNDGIRAVVGYFIRTGFDEGFLRDFITYREKKQTISIAFRLRAIKKVIDIHYFAFKMFGTLHRTQ